jgi:DNA polymerase I-like protein with 3'-5' exonuclease and polymerase domains
MISYVKNPKNDMHRDVCLDLFLKTKDTFTEYERYLAKNGFVFPSFYGSTSRIHTDEDKELGTGVITRNIWERMKEETKEHLAENGISNIYYFQEHIEKIEDKFWNKTFKIYQQWKWDNWRFYKKNGYIELKTGFRCYSRMGFNDVNNYPIQGSAFHVLLWTLIRFNRYLRKKKMKSVIIGQIHDSLVIDLEPRELNHLIGVIKKLIIEVRDYWKWINVPLTIEAEITKLNESWNTKEKIII